MGCERRHLVALHAPQVVPSDGAIDRRRLLDQLVGPVLAHVHQSVRSRRFHGIRAEVLGDGDERDRAPVSAGPLDPVAYLGEAFADALRPQSRHTTSAWRASSPRARQEK